ncbi:hypothetical protein BH09MYX1_BH09MYX1_05650 [soil metagenome]
MVRIAVGTSLCLALLVGCSTSSDDACETYVAGNEAYSVRCAFFPEAYRLGSHDSAVAACRAHVAASGSGENADYFSACGQALSGSSLCTQRPDECLSPHGANADGAPCGTDGQCVSGSCAIESEGCGHCGPCIGTCAAPTPLALGAVCFRNGIPCVAAAHCTSEKSSQSGTCAAWPGLGEACAFQCADRLLCENSVCAARRMADEPCAGADCGEGLYCDSTKHCAKAMVLREGDGCDSTQPQCAAGLTCASGLGPQTKCMTRRLAGAACTSTSQCDVGLLCRKGQCALDDPGACK